jgi:hypothetical protein
VKKIIFMSFVVSILVPHHGSAQDSLRQDILRAIDLPRAAAALREAGVPIDEVQAAVENARRRHVPAAEAEEVTTSCAGGRG